MAEWARDRTILILALILAVAAALRIYGIGAEGYWFDELQSMESSAGRGWVDQSLPRDTVIEKPSRPGSLKTAAPWWRIGSAMQRQEVMPPLYFIILRFWRDAFGDSETATRALSAIASLAAVALLYFVARQIYGESAALWAAALMAIAPTQIEFAHEARTYALTTLFLLAAWLAVLRIERKPTWSAAALLSACLFAAMLTHYFAAGPAIAIGVYVLAFQRRHARRKSAIAIAIAAILCLATWGPAMLAQRANFHRDLGTVLDVTGANSWSGRIGASVALQISKFAPQSAALIIVIVLLTLAALIFQPRRRASIIALLWLFCGIAMLIAIDAAGGSSTLTVGRYGTLFAPALFLLVGGAVAGGQNKWRHLIPALLVAICVFHLHDAYMPWKGQWQATAKLITHDPQPGDIVVIASKESRSWWIGRSFLGLTWFGAGADDRFPLDVVMLTHPPTGDLLARLRRARNFWIITDSTQDGPDIAVPGVKSDSEAFIPNVFMLFRVHWPDSEK